MGQGAQRRDGGSAGVCANALREGAAGSKGLVFFKFSAFAAGIFWGTSSLEVSIGRDFRVQTGLSTHLYVNNDVFRPKHPLAPKMTGFLYSLYFFLHFLLFLSRLARFGFARRLGDLFCTLCGHGCLSTMLPPRYTCFWCVRLGIDGVQHFHSLLSRFSSRILACDGFYSLFCFFVADIFADIFGFQHFLPCLYFP